MTETPRTDALPDRLSVNPKSPFYDEALLARGIGIRDRIIGGVQAPGGYNVHCAINPNQSLIGRHNTRPKANLKVEYSRRPGDYIVKNR